MQIRDKLLLRTLGFWITEIEDEFGLLNDDAQSVLGEVLYSHQINRPILTLSREIITRRGMSGPRGNQKRKKPVASSEDSSDSFFGFGY